MSNAKLHLALAAGAGITAASAHARAHPSSGFTTLDRPGAHSVLGADFGLGLLDVAPFEDDLSLRVDLHGQFLLDSGAGFYGMLPFSHLFLDGDDPDTALGNFEGGMFFVAPAGELDIVLRGGLGLPTADGDLGGILTNGLASSVRVTDIALAYPDTTWMRLSASPVLWSGNGFFRADLGVDVPVTSDVGADPLLRVNVGGGVLLDAVSLLGELAMVFNADEAQEFDDEELITGAFTARFQGGQLEPGVSVLVPISDPVRDLIDLGILFSLQVRVD